jgi:serine/threonine-protein kinase RsbW
VTVPPALELRLRGANAGFGDAIDAVNGFADRAHLPAELRHDVLVIVDEVLSNVLRHGGTGVGDLEVDMRMAIEDDTLVLRFADSGSPFDVLSVQAPDLDIPAGQRPAGGLGLVLIRALTDTQRYLREGGRNVLVLTRAVVR